MENEASYFLEQAQRCRRLAAASTDERVRNTLNLMADEFEQKAWPVRDEAQPKPQIPD